MILEVLGASGGVGNGLNTTGFLIDGQLLLDAGTGIQQLGLDQMLTIRHVLLTHAHLDHIVGLPLLLSTIYERHHHSIEVWALPSVIDALRRHIFNGIIWPDFTLLPAHNPIVCFRSIEVGTQVVLNGYRIEALPARHPSPGIGYFISAGRASFAFTGDSAYQPDFWQRVDQLRPKRLILDVSFSDQSAELAQQSGHMTPEDLARGVELLGYHPQLLLNHLKPGGETEILAGIPEDLSAYVLSLHAGQRFVW